MTSQTLLVEALALLARVPSVLEPTAFQAFARILRERVGEMDIAITMPERPGNFRVLATTRGDRDSLMPYRTLVASAKHIHETLYVKREPYFMQDLSAGVEIEKDAARLGFDSGAAFPISSGDEGAVIGSLTIAFRHASSMKSPETDQLASIARVLGPSVERGLAKQRNDRAARILEASGDALVAWDNDGAITDVNRAFELMTGSLRADLLGRSIRELFGLVPTPTMAGQRLRLLVRDGRRLSVAATVSSSPGDPVVAAHAMLRDMSDVVAAEQDAADRLAQLHELTEQHMVLLDNAPLLIFRLDPESHEVLYLNRHAEHLFGVSAAQALSTPGFLRDAHVDHEGAIAFEEAVIIAKLGQVLSPYEARLRREGSDPIVARGTIYPITSDTGRVLGVEGILLDVTGERAARSRLLQADRLATVGVLAAGVAHEINNPAAFMLLALDLLSKNLASVGPLSEATTQLLVDLKDTGRRIVDIARDLRTFASPVGGSGRKVLVDVGRAIESALTITRAQLMEKADVERQIEPDLPPVAIEEGRLGQVLVNLLVNAAQAVAEVRRTRESRADRVRVRAFADDLDVVIVVEDTGPGIRKELADRVFAPFFTTKPSGQGTGLGLAISKTLVEGAGGTLSIESPTELAGGEGGSAFIIRLPCAIHGDEPARAATPVSVQRLRARVLVVDDEALLGRALASELARFHEVVHAVSGEEALKALGETAFDVILCDLKMPGMGGEELHRRVGEHWPELADRFVFMTGVGFAPELVSFLSRAKAPLLEKPFSVAAALDRIGEVLRGRGAADTDLR